MTLRLSEGCVIIKIPQYYILVNRHFIHTTYILSLARAVISLLGEWITLTNSITFYISFCRVFLPARRQHGRPARRREHRDGLRRRDRHRHRVGQLVRRTLLQVCSSLRCPNVPLFITDFDANSVCTSAAGRAFTNSIISGAAGVNCL